MSQPEKRIKRSRKEEWMERYVQLHSQKIQLLKRIRVLEQEHQKRNEEEDLKFQCFYCQERIICPLQICTDHFACSKCVAAQINFSGLKLNPSYTVNNLPQLNVQWNTNVKCPLCSKVDRPKYPGAIVVHMIDPTCSSKCTFCNISLPLEKVGEHIITCSKQKVACSYCFMEVSVESLQTHIKDECLKLPCRFCSARMAQPKLIVHNENHLLKK